jgi:hypothetical protein
LHLVGILLPHIIDDAWSKSHQTLLVFTKLSKSLNSAECLPQSLSASYSFVNSVSDYTRDVLQHCHEYFKSVAINGHAVAAFFSSVILIHHGLLLM